MDELFAVMDVFVLPSYREGFPHSVMEASAMGLPVVTTNVRGCRDAVINGVTGIIIEPKNAEELAKAMARLLQDVALAKSLGQEGRKKALRDFDERAVFEKMEKILQTYAN